MASRPVAARLPQPGLQVVPCGPRAPCRAGRWVSFVARGGQFVPIREDTRLQPGDEVLVLA